MRAVILAGGKGTRLRPYTTVLPKPLVPVAERPILELVIRQLARHGFAQVDLSVGHLGGLIKAYLDQRRAARGTQLRLLAGGRAPRHGRGAARIDDLDETFLVMNGDILTTLDFGQLMRFHRAQNARADNRNHGERRHRLGVIEPRTATSPGTSRSRRCVRRQHGRLRLRPDGARADPERHFDFPDVVKLLIDRGRKVAVVHRPRELVRHRHLGRARASRRRRSRRTRSCSRMPDWQVPLADVESARRTSGGLRDLPVRLAQHGAADRGARGASSPPTCARPTRSRSPTARLPCT